MNRQHELKNRYLHLDFVEKSDENIQSANESISKCKNCTLDELLILKIIVSNPSVTQKELARRIGKSERTVKNKTVILQEKGYIRRLNGKRNGSWEVLVELP